MRELVNVVAYFGERRAETEMSHWLDSDSAGRDLQALSQEKDCPNSTFKLKVELSTFNWKVKTSCKKGKRNSKQGEWKPGTRFYKKDEKEEQ